MANPSFDQLLTQLESIDPQNPDAQWQAAIRLGDLGDTRAVDPLLRSLRSGNQALVRAHSAQAFWKILDARSLAPLIESLRDPYYLVRSYAARALGKLHAVDPAKSSVEPLMAVLSNDPFFGVRAEAAEALGILCKGDRSEACRRARERLEKHLEDADKDERRWRVTREVERALVDIRQAVRELRAIGSRLDEMSPREWKEFWKTEGRKGFSSKLSVITRASRLIGAPIGA